MSEKETSTRITFERATHVAAQYLAAVYGASAAVLAGLDSDDILYLALQSAVADDVSPDAFPNILYATMLTFAGLAANCVVALVWDYLRKEEDGARPLGIFRDIALLPPVTVAIFSFGLLGTFAFVGVGRFLWFGFTTYWPF